MRLKHACVDAGEYGFNVTPDEYRSEGTRLIRTSDLSDGSLASGGIYVEGPVDERHRLRPGDLLLSRSGTIGRAFEVPPAAAGSTFAGFLVRFRPSVETLPRYLFYATQAKGFQDQVASGAISSTIQNFNADRYANVDIPRPSLAEQRRIADFLDDQVSRIDETVRVRQLEIAQLPELFIAAAGELLRPYVAEGPPLGVVTAIIDTEHKTAPTVAGGGHWIAGTSALRGGRLRHAALRETKASSYEEWTRRGVPRAGDVLLSREAPVGEVALLEVDDPRVAIGQRVVLLHPAREVVRGDMLRLVLMSPVLQRVIADASVGSLHPHLNMADISRLRMPAIPLEDQAQVAAEHGRQLDERDRVRGLLERSVEMLREYKQSLITAAITGEFDFTTSTGRSIPT